MIFYRHDGLFNLFKVGFISLGELLQCLVHTGLDTNVIHYQSLLLALVFAVYSGDGLDQAVLLNRLINVDGVQAGHIKAGEPHIHHNGDLEVGFFIFELLIQLLAILLATQKVIKLVIVVFIARHHHFDPFHGVDVLLLLLCQSGTRLTGQNIKPFRLLFPQLLIKRPGHLALAGNKYRLALDGGAFRHPVFIVMNKIDCQCLNPVRVTENTVHTGGGLLTLFDLVFTGTGLGALVVILFDLRELAVIQNHFGGTAFVDNTDGDLIFHRFVHGIGVHRLTKNRQRGVDGRAGKTNVGGIGQGLVQMVGKAVSLANTVVSDANLLVFIDLAAVGLIGDADHIGAVGEQFSIFGKLVNGRQENTTAGVSSEQGTQFSPAGYRDNVLVVHVLLGIKNLL